MAVSDILQVLIRVNLAAACAIVLVLILRKIARGSIGARLAYSLWLLPILAGAAVLAPPRQVIVAAPVARAFVPIFDAVLSPPPIALPTMSASPAPVARPAAHRRAPLDFRLMALALWFAGIAGSGLVMIHLQRRFVSEARNGLIGPAVVGVIAPRIVKPKDFDQKFSGEEQTLVLAHEQAHISRQDSRLNGVSAVLQCLFWFNPLIHLAAHLARIDQELACDETVVARFPDARRAYARALVKAQLAIRPLPLGCYWPSGNQHPLMERIAMLKLKDFSRARRLAGGTAIAALCVAAGAAAWAAQPAQVRIAALTASQGRPTRSALAASLPASAAQTAPALVQLAQNSGSDNGAVPDGSHPGTAAAVRKFFTAMMNGSQDYDDMTPALAAIARSGADGKIQLIQSLGALKSIQFDGVDDQGLDHYLITFAGGTVESQTILAADGKADLGSNWVARVAPPGAHPEHVGATSPLPGTEAALRKFFASLAAGNPNYDDNTPQMAAALQNGIDGKIQTVQALGAFKSDTFLRVDLTGADVFEFDFANGKELAQVSLDAFGKTAARGWGPMPDQTQDAARTALLGLDIAGLASGAPIYDKMSDGLVASTRQQLPALQQTMQKAGALKSIAFEYVTPSAQDVYLATFENARQEWTVGPLTPDGKLNGIVFRTLP